MFDSTQIRIRSHLAHHLPTPMKIVSAIAILLSLSISAGLAQESDDIKHLKALADWGDSDAEYQLGVAYETGVGTAQDYATADFWYSHAALHGNKKAAAHRVVIKDAVARSMSEDARTQATSSYYPNRKANETGISFDPKPTTPQSDEDVPAWKKALNAVVAAPAKAKAFLTDHSDDLTEVAAFAIEEYLTGSEPTGGTVSKAEASDAGRTLREYREQQQGK